ncbi:MAG TPA: hypothetical protein VMZ28_20530 [Kofleriaceae bacterium]|nr:hypothetical protein [Kofleriaceae bacterium]
MKRITPVANLQVYSLVQVRGTGADASGQGDAKLAYELERAALVKIREKCAFVDVVAGAQPAPRPPDLLLDATILRSGRGGDGLVQNENLAVVDVKLVLSDGVDQELLGSADIQGKSSGVDTGGSPEQEALEAVAGSIADILVKSGCVGPRVARATPPTPPGPVGTPPGPGTTPPGPGTDPGTGTTTPPGPGTDPGTGTTTPPADDPVAKAEAENEAGKAKFRSADVAGAKAHFETAISIHKDARFVFNLCLAQEALNELDAAAATCQSINSMNPPAALADKVKLRLEIIADKKKNK